MVLAKRKPVHGFGINDSDYKTVLSERVDGVLIRVWGCPYYLVWKDMLMRCYSDKYLEKNPSYSGCTVCEDWLYFSKFKLWMEKQDWKEKALDKDIKLRGNKHYSPETCIFVPSELNQLVAHINVRKVGVRKIGNKFSARICIKRQEIRKSFNTYEEAKQYWISLQKDRLLLQAAKHADNSVIVDYLWWLISVLEE